MTNNYMNVSSQGCRLRFFSLNIKHCKNQKILIFCLAFLSPYTTFAGNNHIN